jgi:tetratricopeptide (TPR) repeat protein
MKALEKDRNRRYETANGLAADIQHYLSDEPVVACPPSVAYRLRKFVRRHRVSVLASSLALVALVVVAGVSLAAAMTFQRMADQNANLARDLKAALGDAERNLAQVQEKEQLAQTNLALAIAEQQRAEANLDLALKAMDAVYLEAIGRDKLLGEMVPRPDGKGFMAKPRAPLTELEKQLLQRGLSFYDKFAQQNSTTPRAAVQTAQAYHRVGLLQAALEDHQAAESAYRAAVDRYESLTHEFPNRPEYIRALAECYYGLANCARWRPDVETTYFKAVEKFSTAIALKPNDASSFYRRALVHHVLNHHKQALADYEKAIELEPENGQFQFAIADFLRLAQDPKLRDYDRAIKHYQKAIELAPANYSLHTRLASLYVNQLNDPQRAREHVDAALALAPSDPYALRIRGRVFWSLGEHDRALVDLDKSLGLQPDVWGYKDRANVYTALRQFEKAFTDFALAEQRDPNNLYVYEERGDLYLTLGRYEDAIREYDKAIRDLDEAIRLDPKYAQAHAALGAALSDTNDLDGTIRHLKEAVNLDPKDNGARLNLGIALSYKADWDGAIACLKEVVRLEPKHATAHAALGTALSEKNELDAAIASYKEAIRLDPRLSLAHHNLGNALRAKGDLDGAIASYREEIRLRPEHAEAHANLGFRLARKGLDDEAIACYREAVRLKPELHNVHRQDPRS